MLGATVGVAGGCHTAYTRQPGVTLMLLGDQFSIRKRLRFRALEMSNVRVLMKEGSDFQGRRLRVSSCVKACSSLCSRR